MFKVSVIIPVYNAERYIERAIRSAITQSLVGEVIIIDDAYPDNAINICRKLQSEYTNLIILQHPRGENKGAGPSRNLGMRKANFPYIAFLDADDYYLPNRFNLTNEIFNSHPKANIVYESVGIGFENYEAKVKFCKAQNIELKKADYHTTNMKMALYGRDFLIALLKGRNGSPHLNGITIRKEVLNGIDPWFKSLKLHQDSEFWVRLAYYGDFYPGDPDKPVAIRWVHNDNRITKRNYASRLKKERELLNWSKKEIRNDKTIIDLVYKRYIFAQTQKMFKSSNILVLVIAKIRFIAFQIFSKG